MSARGERLQAVAKRREHGVIVVLEDIHDPHNASAIMRSADAFGIQDVWLVFEHVAAWNPRRVGKSSSSSANKWLSFRVFKTTADAVEALVGEGYTSVAAVVDGDIELGATDFAMPTRIALWIGNEHGGLSAAAQSAADMRVRIPMRGMVESLNVSVAAALFMYEITQQRHSSISDAEAIALADKWMKR